MSIKDSTFYILAIHMYAESKNIRILNRSVYRGRNNVPSCVTYRLVAFNVAAESSVKWSTWAEGPLKCNDHIHVHCSRALNLTWGETLPYELLKLMRIICRFPHLRHVGHWLVSCTKLTMYWFGCPGTMLC